MDDRNLANWVGAGTLGLALAAAAWMLVSPSTGARGPDQVRVSGGRHVSHAWDPNRPPEHQRQRCVEAAAARGVTGCAAASSLRFAPPTLPALRAQPVTRAGALGATPPPTQVLASAPATVQPSTPQPSSPSPSTAQPSTPPTPTRQPLAHHGPVPGGSTSPPTTGPRP